MGIKFTYKRKSGFIFFLDMSVLLTMCFIYGNEKTEELRLFYTSTFVWACLSLILIISRYYYNKRVKLLSFSSLWYLVFSFWCYISIRWSILPEAAMENFGFIYKTCIIMMLIDIYINNVKDGMRKITNYFFIALIYLAIRTLIYVPFDEIIGESIGIQFNNIAQVLAIGVNIGFYHIYFLKEKRYIIPFLLMVIVVLMTTSRKAFLFMFLGVLLQLLFVKGIKEKFKSILIILATASLMIFLVFNVPSLYEKFGSRLLDAFQYFSGNGIESTDISIVQRTFYANHAIELFKNKPIIGNGLMSVYSSLLVSNAQYVAYAHNNYLELLASLGIIGLVIYYFAYIIILKKGISFLKNRNQELILWFSVICIVTLAQVGVVAYYFNFYSIIISLAYHQSTNIYIFEKSKQKSIT
ncbi:MAG: O-antigen ligase family protein [Clostridium beijerinckii]|nr:O-antigen ligase family protein [Clostridium beijerinckii]